MTWTDGVYQGTIRMPGSYDEGKRAWGRLHLQALREDLNIGELVNLLVKERMQKWNRGEIKKGEEGGEVTTVE